MTHADGYQAIPGVVRQPHPLAPGAVTKSSGLGRVARGAGCACALQNRFKVVAKFLKDTVLVQEIMGSQYYAFSLVVFIA